MMSVVITCKFLLHSRQRERQQFNYSTTHGALKIKHCNNVPAGFYVKIVKCEYWLRWGGYFSAQCCRLTARRFWDMNHLSVRSLHVLFTWFYSKATLVCNPVCKLRNHQKTSRSKDQILRTGPHCYITLNYNFNRN